MQAPRRYQKVEPSNNNPPATSAVLCAVSVKKWRLTNFPHQNMDPTASKVLEGCSRKFCEQIGFDVAMGSAIDTLSNMLRKCMFFLLSML